jgi:hypothetical protein
MEKNWLDIKIDKAQLNKVGLLLKNIPNGLRNALKKAVRKTATETKKQIIDAEANALHIKKRYISRAIHLSKATRMKTGAKISVWGRRIPLIAFRTHRAAHGFSFEAGGFGVLSAAFKATMPGGHKGIYKRYTAGWRGSRKVGVEYGGEVNTGLAGEPVVKRLPLQEIFGPSPGAIFEAAPGLSAGVKLFAGTMLERMLDIQTETLLRGGNLERALSA